MEAKKTVPPGPGAAPAPETPAASDEGPRLSIPPMGGRKTTPAVPAPPAPAARDPGQPHQKLRMSITPFAAAKSTPSGPAASEDAQTSAAENGGTHPPERVKLRTKVSLQPPPSAEAAGEGAAIGRASAEARTSATPFEPHQSAPPVPVKPPTVPPVPVTPPTTPPVPGAGEPVPASPAAAEPDAGAAEGGSGKLRLKPKDPTTPALPETDEAEEAPEAPPRAPVVAKKPPASSRSVVRLVIGVGGALVLGLAGFLAYLEFFSAPPPLPPPPPRRPVARKVSAPPKVAATPAKPPPAPAVAKPATAKTATKAGVAKPAVASAPAVAKPVVPAGPPPPPKPSQEFRQYVEQLRITGLRTGPPARMFVGGVTYQDGDVINQDLGVVFVGVDPKTQLLIFKDRTGAIVRRPF